MSPATGGVPWFQTVVLLLLVIGLLSALIFLAAHRPRRRWRWQAMTVTAWPILIFLFYLRSIVIILIRWPGQAPTGVFDLVWSLSLLGVIDILLIAMLVSYRSFVSADRDRLRERIGPPPLE